MKKLNYAIIFVADMQRSVSFYRDTLKLPLKFESPEWTEFANEGSTIALHLARASAPPGDRATAGTVQPGFQVDDLDAFHKEMTDKQVVCIQPPKIEGFGMKLAVYTDPDGLLFSVGQVLSR